MVTPMTSEIERDVDLIALDDALAGLAKSYPRKCRIVELRFFGGLSTDEIAAQPANVHWYKWQSPTAFT